MGFLYAITAILLMSLLHPVLGVVSAVVVVFMAWLYSGEETKEQKEASGRKKTVAAISGLGETMCWMSVANI